MIVFLINRAKRHWQVLSIVMLGVLVSTALMACGPLIVNTVMDFALQHKFRSTLAENGTLFITSHNNLSSEQYKLLDEDIRELIQSEVNHLSELININSSSLVFPWQDDAIIDNEGIQFRSFGGIEKKIRFVSGDWPKNPWDGSNLLQAVVFEPLAQAYKLEVGDRLPLSIKNSEAAPSLWMEVSGIIEPINASEPYWIARDHEEIINQSSQLLYQYTAVIPEADLFQINEILFPTKNHEHHWFAVINFDHIKSNDSENIVAGIESLRRNLSALETRTVISSNIDQFLISHNQNATLIRPSIYLLVGEVLLLGLYYVIMVAALSMRQVEVEFATLASRGASRGQLLRLQAFESIFACSIAFIFGPLLAYLLVWSLANIGPLANVSQSAWISRLPAASWAAAGISSLACFTALMLPVFPSLRESVVQYRRTVTRRVNKPWWQKYFIDVFILIVGLAAFWRLTLYGSLSVSNNGGVDWLLLLAPLALLIGTAMILLRLFPPIFSFLANIAGRGRGLVAALTFWGSARDPSHVTRFILLFTFAMALGILSSGLNATLTSSEIERARYSAGGEVRLISGSFIPPSSVFSLQDVSHASSVWRGEGSANVRTYRSMPRFKILAIEPYSFATVSKYRTDFTNEYVGFTLGKLIVHPDLLPVKVIQLPGQPTHLGVWIADPHPERYEVDLMEHLSIRAKIQSAEGEIETIEFRLAPAAGDENIETAEQEVSLGEPVPTSSWRYFEAEIPPYTSHGYPLSLHSIWLKIRPIDSNAEVQQYSPGPLIIDDISTTDHRGQIEIIEDFDQLSTIWQTNDPRAVASYTKRDITHSGEASLRLFFALQAGSRFIVLSPAQPLRREPIPALASPVFLDMTGMAVGDVFIAHTNSVRILLEIKGAVNYFPTMYDSEENGYLIISRDALLAELNRTSRNPVNPNEIWLMVGENQDIPTLLEKFPQATEAKEIETEQSFFKADPLTLGLRTIIFLGYYMTLTLSLVGFATYFYISARQREPMYGVLRSLGLSTSQLYISLVFEQSVLIISGLALGIFLGSILNRIILPDLPISFGDLPPIPPFIPKGDWNAVGRLIIVILICFLITLGIGTLLLWRTKLHNILRVGEE